MKKILIAVPAMDMVSAYFAQSLASLQSDPDWNCHISFVLNSLVYDARNDLCTQAIKGHFDYIMWFDSDMVFPPDVIHRLMEHLDNGCDIVTGVYFRRRPPYTPVLYSKLDFDMENESIEYEPSKEIPEDGLFEVQGCGFGCVLMKTAVLHHMGLDLGLWFEPIGGIGEDLAFCIRAAKAGYKVFADPTIRIGHVGTLVVDKQFYDTYTDPSKR